MSNRNMRLFFITIILFTAINALSAQTLYENPICAYIDGTEVLSYKTDEHEISFNIIFTCIFCNTACVG